MASSLPPPQQRRRVSETITMKNWEELSISLKEKFFEIYDTEPEFASFAPGRVEIIGNHTDYNDGYVL